MYNYFVAVKKKKTVYIFKHKIQNKKYLKYIKNNKKIILLLPVEY